MIAARQRADKRGVPPSARAGGAECRCPRADPAGVLWGLVGRLCGSAEVVGGLLATSVNFLPSILTALW